MNGRRSHNGNASLNEESSGVTRLSPVPVKTMRLSGLDDNDRTQFFSVNLLLERGKAVAAREQERAAFEQAHAASAVATAAPVALVNPEPPPRKPGLVQQLREASFARKAILALLPMLILLLLFKPAPKESRREASATAAHSSQGLAIGASPLSVPAPAASELRAGVALAATPPQPAPTLPRGVSLEKAAADALAAGDFGRALGLYRELARREPTHAAYAHAVTILERRTRIPAP